MTRNYPPDIAQFLAVGSFAVVGASTDREKYGNKVLRCYQQHDLPVVGVNPKVRSVEGATCYATLRDVPDGPRAVSVVAPPGAAAQVLADARAAGATQVWFQPGAEDMAAVETARTGGMNVIAGGPCLLVALGFRDE